MNTAQGILRNQNGVVIVYVAIAMVIFLGFAALAVDVGHIMVARTELQKIADGAALAGARALGRLYQCNGDLTATDATCQAMSGDDQLSYVADVAAIRQAAKDVALQNQAGGSTTGIVINDADIVIGNWDPVHYPRPDNDPLRPTDISPDAVRVTARRDSEANGPITNFFARILGIDTTNVSATATAALTGQTTVDEGGLPVPMGISSYFFDNPEFCHDNITFYPSNSPDSCAGWHIYDQDAYNHANDRALRDTIGDLDSGDYQSPALTVGTEFKFTGGTMSTQTFDAMQTLYLHNADADGNWAVSVPVYQAEDCGNPSGELAIVGFARVIITGVEASPEHTIYGTVECDYVDPENSRGGGNYYGTKGSIPGLVE